jgi:hypothetical protein
MQTDLDFNDMTGHLTGPLLDFYLTHQQTLTHPLQIIALVEKEDIY